MPDDSIKPNDLVLKIKDLPVIPTAVAEILRVVNDAGSSSTDIEWAVSRDQSIAGHVLRVVNSAAYGFMRRVETIREAIVMLGMRKMRDIAASMAAADLFTNDKDGIVDGKQLWVHSLATSIWSRKIINIKRFTDMDVVVTAALLHDIGILIMHQYCNEQYTPVLIEARESNRHHSWLEKKLLKTTHARIGAQLCAKWQLPISVTQLISHHHTRLAPSDPALGVLLLADHLACESGYGPFQWGCTPALDEEILDLLEIAPADMDTLINTRQDIIDQVEEFKAAALGNS